MAEQPSNRDVVELVRGFFAAASGGDLDALADCCQVDAVWDATCWGLGVAGGREKIRRLVEDWTGSFAEYEVKPTEIDELGDGIAVVTVERSGRPSGSRSEIRLSDAVLFICSEGRVVRMTNFAGVGEARAAGEGLARAAGAADAA